MSEPTERDLPTGIEPLNANTTIGIFDSGVGGLSVARAIMEQRPNDSIIYIADHELSPYGDKTPSQIRERSLQIAEFLRPRCHAIVIACNTATAAGIDALRNEHNIPIYGLEPAIKPAVQQSKTGVVGVLATEQTLKSPAFARLVKRYQHQSKIITQGCPDFIPMIEAGNIPSPYPSVDALADNPKVANTNNKRNPDTAATIHQNVIDLCQRYVQPLLEAGADQIVLGCSHYVFLKPALELVCNGKANIINTAEALAKHIAGTDLLKPPTELSRQGSSLPDYTPCPQHKFYSTALNEQRERTMKALWPEVIEILKLEL